MTHMILRLCKMAATPGNPRMRSRSRNAGRMNRYPLWRSRICTVKYAFRALLERDSLDVKEGKGNPSAPLKSITTGSVWIQSDYGHP